MKIVHAAGWYFPTSTGGTEVYVDAVARRLRAAGHEVLVAAPETQGDGERAYEHKGVPVYRYSIPPVVTRDEAQARVVVRGADRFHAWLARVRPDVVHIHTFVSGLGPWEVRAARAAGARVVVTSHSAALGFTCQRGTMMRWGRGLCDGHVSAGKCAPCALHHRGLPRPLALVAGLVPAAVGRRARVVRGRLGTTLAMTELIGFNQDTQRELLEQVDRFVVLTDWARQVLLDNGAPPDKVALSRLGVRFAPGARSPRGPGPLTVAYVGRFDPVKGVADFARAIARVPHTLPMRFEFHGPVRHKAELGVLDRLKRIVGPDASVTFGGELDTSGVRQVLGRIDVLCSPSRVVEGGPTVAIEAMAAGVPVIGTDLPGLSELVRDGENGRLVRAGDYRGLARALRELAVNPGALESWRAALEPMRTMDDVTRECLELYGA